MVCRRTTVARCSAYLARQRRWLTVERLPGYAPDLNPVEVLWGNIKGQELANLCPDDLGDVAAALGPAWPASAGAPHWRTPSSSTPASLFDRCVTVLCETHQ